MQNKNKRILIGKIATAHGIRGLVKVLVYAEDPHLLDSHGPLFISERDHNTLSLTMKNSAGKYWLAAVDGINDRNEAEKLRSTELWIDREKLPRNNSANEFYVADLIGLSVYDETGQLTGKIIAVENFGAGDLLEIKPQGAASFYLPFTKDGLIDIDIKAGTLTIRIPEGLF